MGIDGQFGGRVTFEFAGNRIAAAEGDIVLDPSLVEVKAEANQDGSGCYHLKPKLVGAKIKLRHQNGMDWNALMFLVGNCTIAEENNDRTHLFTKTRLTGKPEVNVSTGEVDGLMIEGGTYQRVG